MNKFYCVESVYHNNHKISINCFAANSDTIPEDSAKCGEDADTYRSYFKTAGEAKHYQATCISSAITLKLEII